MNVTRQLSSPAVSTARNLFVRRVLPSRSDYNLASNRSSSVVAMATPEPVLFIKSKVGSPGELGDCPFCHRVLLTLEAKHVPYKRELVDLDNKPQWLLDASGGKVPVIRYEESGPLIPDSDVIVVQLEEKYPQPSTKSSVPPEIGAKLFPAFRGFLMGPAAEAAEKEAAFLGELKAINTYLESTGGPLFGGDAINATDAAVAPKLYHAEVALKHYKGWTIPAELGTVHKYLTAIKALPAWQSVDYGTDAIIKGWDRHFAQAH